MGSLNKVMLIGNLGKDAELRYTPSGQAVANFSMATTETWNDKQGQKQERTEWHRVDVWGKTAENLTQYLTKGKQVYVEGRIQTDKYTDKEGIERWSTKIRCDRVTLLGKANGNGGGARQVAPSDDDTGGVQPLNDDDIPF